MAVPSGSRENPVVVRIKPGIYPELIYIQREKSFFKLTGENPTKTILTFDLYAGITDAAGKPIGTFKRLRIIEADDFSAENITFEIPPGKGPALAINVTGDRAVFRNCRFLGWQDTILLNRGRQYFDNCYIAGQTISLLSARRRRGSRNAKSIPLRDGYLTAASTPQDFQPFGFVFANCNITGGPGVKTYLGRPWRIYASTIFLNTDMSDVVRPEGWNDWSKPETPRTGALRRIQQHRPRRKSRGARRLGETID